MCYNIGIAVIKQKESQNLFKSLGKNSLTILTAMAESGVLILEELLAGRGRRLKSQLREPRVNLVKLKEGNIRTIISRLKYKGLIQKDGTAYRITDAGSNYLKNQNNKEKSWDGKWRMVFFDIPEKQRKHRNWIRAYLDRIEYRPLQKSVFLGKHPFEETFFSELMEKNLYKYVRIITVGEIDDESILTI